MQSMDIIPRWRDEQSYPRSISHFVFFEKTIPEFSSRLEILILDNSSNQWITIRWTFGKNIYFWRVKYFQIECPRYMLIRFIIL